MILNNIEYLYPDVLESSQRLEFIHDASLNWYKNEHGEDIIKRNEISIGPIIAKSVAASFANDYRNYLGIKSLFSRFDTIYISKNAPISFERVSKVFKNQIKWFYSNENSVSNTSSPIRGQIFDYPKIHKLSNIARLIQRPFISLLKNKILIFSDWTYGDVFLRNKDCLSFNRLNVLKGCYLKNTKYSHELIE